MEIENLINFFIEAGKLKEVPRSGWKIRGIQPSESVADHTFRCGIIAMVLGDIFKLNAEKLIKMSLIHDLPEVITGDITPFDGITHEEKNNREREALILLMKNLPNGREYLAIWDEYRAGKSPEAIFMNNIDKLELVLQGMEYNRQQGVTDMDQMLKSSLAKVNATELQDFVEVIKSKIE